MGSSLSLPKFKKFSLSRRPKDSPAHSSTSSEETSKKYRISAPLSINCPLWTSDDYQIPANPFHRTLISSPNTPTESPSSSKPLVTSLDPTTHHPTTPISSPQTLISSPKPSSTNPTAAIPAATLISSRTTSSSSSSSYHHHPSISTSTRRSSRTLIASPTASTLTTIWESQNDPPFASAKALTLNIPLTPSPSTRTTHRSHRLEHLHPHPTYPSCLQAQRDTRRRIEESDRRQASVREKNAGRRGEWDVYRRHRVRVEDGAGWYF